VLLDQYMMHLAYQAMARGVSSRSDADER
jgi:hypothetical protein